MIASTIPLPRPLIYVAGPYSGKTPGHILTNVNAAMDAGDALDDSGVCRALIPHILGHFRNAHRPRTYAEWLSIDIDLLLHCDGVLRIAGQSEGADGEVAIAHKLGMPVFHSVKAAVQWARAKA